LDKSRGGEIAQNLEALYLYMQERLLQANLHNQVEPLDEVASLLREIKTAWDAIGEQAQINKPVAATV
jgi:flagellar protein FliS